MTDQIPIPSLLFAVHKSNSQFILAHIICILKIKDFLHSQDNQVNCKCPIKEAISFKRITCLSEIFFRIFICFIEVWRIYPFYMASFFLHLSLKIMVRTCL